MRRPDLLPPALAQAPFRVTFSLAFAAGADAAFWPPPVSFAPASTGAPVGPWDSNTSTQVCKSKYSSDQHAIAWKMAIQKRQRVKDYTCTAAGAAPQSE